MMISDLQGLSQKADSYRVIPSFFARISKYVSPEWRSKDRMIIMKCLVPTCSHRPAAPKQSLKRSKMCIFFGLDVSKSAKNVKNGMSQQGVWLVEHIF
jgi:hypothetical protein